MLAAWLAVLTLGIFATALSVDGCYSSGLLITDISLWESVSCQCRLGSGALGFGLTQARPLLLRHPQPGQTKSPPLSLLVLHSCPAFNIRRGAIPAVALPSPSSRRHCSLFPPRPSTRLAAHPPHASHAHHPARPPPPGRHPDTPRQRLPLGDARTLDALTEILARYLALLAARDSHGSATPDVTDARMAMADCGLLTPAAMAAQEVWLEILRTPLKDVPARNGLRDVRAELRRREDAGEVDEFVEWACGPAVAELRRVAGLARDANASPAAGEPVERAPDYLTGL